MKRARFATVLFGLCLASAVCARADIVSQPVREFGLGDLQAAVISPDGRWMATCGSGGAFIWSFQTGTLLHHLESPPGAVLSLCFAPSGVLLTGGADAVARAWDVESGTELRSFLGSIGRIFDVSFSPDGQSLVAVADDKARVWSFSTGELLHTFAVPGAGIAQARFAPDGQRLVTAHVVFTDTADSVRVWDLGTGQAIRSFDHSFVDKLEFTADGTLVTGGPDLVVQVWDIDTGELVRPLPGTSLAEQAIVGFLTSTNSPLVVVGCATGRVITWDASTGQIVHDFPGERLFSLAAIPGTNQILTAHPDNLVRVKNSEVGTTLRSIAGHTAGVTQGIGFSPDRRYVVSGGNEALIRLWNRTNADQVRVFEGFAGGTQIASFSPGGAQILTTFGVPNYSRLLNAETGEVEREFFGGAPAFSPDGKKIATVSTGQAHLWDVATGTEIRAFNSPESLLTAVAVSPDGMILASGASSGVARLWNTANGELLRSIQFQFDVGGVSSLKFSPATGELLVAWADGVLRTFDPATGALKLGSLAPGGFVGDAAFSPDGRFILDAEGFPSFSARLWDARTGEELRVFAGQGAEVSSVAFDPTGTLILTGSDLVRLWSIADIAARLESDRKPNGLELRWRIGTLQQSTRVDGPWFDVTDASSPWLVPVDQPSAFFRTKAPVE